MKFEKKYPDARPGGDFSLEQPVPGLVLVLSICNCAICKEQTNWLELNYQCFICSEECLAKMDKGYQEAAHGDY